MFNHQTHGSRRRITSVLKRPIRLGQCIVVGVAAAADRGLDAGLREALRVANGEILRAAGAVMHESLLPGPLAVAVP